MWGSERRLDDFLRGQLKQALDELARIDADVILAEHVEVVVESLLGKYMPVEIAVDWDAPTMTPVSEVSIQVGDQFGRDRTYTVPASKIVVSFPISGSTGMLDYQASRSSMEPKDGSVSGGNVVVEVTERELNAETIRSRVEQAKQDIEKRVLWANSDLANFLDAAKQSIQSSLGSRKARILNDREVEAALGIPVRTSGKRPPVPARRKQITLQARTAQKGFVPEHVLDEAIYQDVLEAVGGWARTLERSPRTAAKLDEEELRDLLLGALNSYWMGEAGGELFNGVGKTDILIRHDGRNAFIAECKIWRGPKSVSDALDQLLGYLVWRDSKAALIMFIKTVDTAATIGKLHEAVAAHPSFVLAKPASDPSSRADYVLTADDEGRRVSLAVIPVVIQSDK